MVGLVSRNTANIGPTCKDFLVIFEMISQECSWGDLFKKFLHNFDPSVNMALVNGGYFSETAPEILL